MGRRAIDIDNEIKRCQLTLESLIRDGNFQNVVPVYLQKLEDLDQEKRSLNFDEAAFDREDDI